MVNYLLLLSDCVIDSRGCDESIFVTLCTQVSGPPWPLPSGPFSLSNKPLPIPPLHSVIGSLTSLCLAHPTGSDQSNQSTAQTIIGQLALTFSSPPDNEISIPASSFINPHSHPHRETSGSIHSGSSGLGRVQLHAPTTSLIYQWTQCSFLHFAAPHYMLVVLRSSKWPPIPITAPVPLVNGLGPSICWWWTNRPRKRLLGGDLDSAP